MPLKSVILSVINNALQSCGESATTDVEEHDPVEVMADGKCQIYLKVLHGLEDKERRQRKANLSKIKGKCKHCVKSTCPSHQPKKVEDRFHCYILSDIIVTYVHHEFQSFLATITRNGRNGSACGYVLANVPI